VVALEAAIQYPSCHVIGIDLSKSMLNQAQMKAEKAKLDHIEFVQVDLDKMVFPAQYFDVATCRFGLFFLDDIQEAMNRLVSTVKTKGLIGITSFSEGAFEPMSALFLQRFEFYGFQSPPLSWKKMTTEDQLIDLFAQASISDVKIYTEPLGFHMTSANDWWDIVWNAGYRGLLTQLSESQLIHFKREHLMEIQALCDAGDTWLDTGLMIAIGRLD